MSILLIRRAGEVFSPALIATLISMLALFGCSHKTNDGGETVLEVANPDNPSKPGDDGQVDSGGEPFLAPPYLTRFKPNWSGTAQWSDNFSKRLDCKVDRISIVENADYFAVQQVQANCGKRTYPWFNKLMQKRGERLFWNGVDVGGLNAGGFNIQINDRGLLWSLQGTFSGSGLQMTETQESAGHITTTRLELQAL